MTSTAVVPYFRVTRGLIVDAPLWQDRQAEDAYRCRTCDWERRFFKDISRDTRMIVLARHLADAHGTGPLMAGRHNQAATA